MHDLEDRPVREDSASSTASAVELEGTGSRRGLLASGIGMAAVLAGFARRSAAQGAQPAGPHARAARSLAGVPRFLVDRITNGWSPATIEHAEALGYAAYLEEQLNPDAIAEDANLLAALAALPTLTLTSKQLYDQYVAVNQTAVVVNELKTATILRGMYSTGQLRERMVEFWSDHFSVDHSDGQVQWLKTAEDRDVIRPNALGNFHDLVRADARSAAMLYYLDNYRNFASAPNENYARELMELHTLGVGQYTETDVRELARILSGWQYRPQANAIHGAFFFNPAQHDNGAKTFLGVPFPANGGEAEGLLALDMLAAHPATAEFVSRKLLRWLLTYNPPQPVVDSVARVFRNSGGDIPSVLRAIFDVDLVAAIPAASLPKLKRPFHYMCSLVRACAPTITQPIRYVNELTTMGHRPFGWPAPNGYPESLEVWGQSVLPRWTFATRFVDGAIQGTSVNVSQLFGSTPKSALAQRANQILGGALDPEDVAAVQAYADSVVLLNDTLRRDVLELSAQAPSFQYV